MLTTLLDILHILVCAILMFVVLLQQGRGGGMGAAFGSGGAAQVFGGRGAGNLLTRMTGACAFIFMLTSVSLAYLSSSGDRDLREREKLEAQKRSNTAESKTSSEAPSPAKKSAEAPAPEPKAPESKSPETPAPEKGTP